MASMFATVVPDVNFDFESTSPSMLMSDMPYQFDSSCDSLAFKTESSDVPDDLLACTPIHGWDSPPESPVHSQVLDGFSDPLIENVSLDLSCVSQKLSSFETDFDWATPPQSPEPSADMSNCDELMSNDWTTPPASPVPSCDDLMASFPEDMDDMTGMLSFKEELPDTASFDPVAAAKPSLKRKSGGSAKSDVERKRAREKRQSEREKRTTECDTAVQALTATKADLEDPETRRMCHNVLERKRRNDLKNSYQYLREALPTLEDRDRAPTGQILLHAVEYVQALKKDEAVLLEAVASAKAENERLKTLLIGQHL